MTLLDFPRGGHIVGALVPYQPFSLALAEGVSPDADQRARAVAWKRLLRFLRGV